MNKQDRRPRWLRQLDHYLPASPQFIITGNIRDVHLVPIDGEMVLHSTVGAIWEMLKCNHYELLLVYDPIDGLRIEPEGAGEVLGGTIGEKRIKEGPLAIEELKDWITEVGRARTLKCSMIIDYASRIGGLPQNMGAPERELFASVQKIAHNAQELRPQGEPQFNPILWIVDQIQDLPHWLTAGTDQIRSVAIPLPDRTSRLEAASHIGRSLSEPNDNADSLYETFADLTDGLSIRAMVQVRSIARKQNLALEDIGDAVRSYKVGVPENPWREPYLLDKIARAEENIRQYVKGQDLAVSKTLDILKRSVMGLTNAQAAGNPARPRGVLFFAGPTGVGKTELAKSITRILFGDEEAYIRFDMSEFATEQSGERLTGAPPGYVGYDQGGELVNAVRARPFCVVLFDEVEKAHGRVLDRFLQILDGGRLTDSHGSTVYFTESVIVFTSNLGIYKETPEGVRMSNVTPGDSYETVQAKVLAAIEDHFRYRLERPELLNRIGENIVVFDFIRPIIGREILEAMVRNVARRVRDEHGVEVELAPAARTVLEQRCLSDLAHGGRGIGNQLERALVNPLARELFALGQNRNTRLIVKQLTGSDSSSSLVIVPG